MKNPVKRFLTVGFLLCLTALPFFGCSTLQQLAQMATLTQCQFRMVSVEHTTVAGIDLRDKSSLSDIGPLDLVRLQSVFTSGTLPLQFTLNLEGKNPNSSSAGMNRFAWILYMDGNELTSGELEKGFEIPADGGVTPIPLAVSLDLRKALTGKTLDSMLNLALNIAGEGSKPTRISLKMKPTITVAGQDLDYPDYITVTREFGGSPKN
jgi:hypothetical protein